jgi:hypothetical protein
MTTRPTLRLLLCGLLAAGALGLARPSAAQSPLSLVNLGAPIPDQDARMDGRGGWGLAESDSLVPAFKNLAGLPGLDRIAIMLWGFGDRTHSSGDADARTTYRVKTPNLRLAIPLRNQRLVFTAGMRSLRSTQYETSFPEAWPVPGVADSLQPSGNRLFQREGTQYEFPLGAAFGITPRLSAAVSLNLARGMIRETASALITAPLDPNSNVLYRTPVMMREDQIDGTSFTFGLQARPLRGLALGATFTPAYDWGIDRTLELSGVGQKADTSFTWHYPQAWGLGAACRVAPRWRVGVDWETTQLSKFRGPPDWQTQNTDEWAVSFGCERGEAQVRRGGLGNLPLRLGATVRRWGYLVGGEPVQETRLALGTGFPFRAHGGHLDVALSYGWIGDQATNGYSDRVWRLSVSAVGLERWW